MTTPAHAPDQPTRLLDALDDMTTTPEGHAFIAGIRTGLTLDDLDHDD
ncbi:hypothetical protein [Gordonia sp. (in: high G+C Gram-positive bacteria)]|jgi:hypothetical protein|nr:hypothetical protein [Gordonia sp. (in: high G+C Gram-positive bacteria)]MCB1293831.1 hypothetical protein [Gordonia sp. (in: high G+C Gram-positive bacteria)]HMS75075.1 hypothetical protein [Gordonia sp. (in: high G+C Gram-positive bacteria)]HQV18677.1 hypothetical protein [Gordonia sp. (in: high G+C Gram-positive bacteria)]